MKRIVYILFLGTLLAGCASNVTEEIDRQNKNEEICFSTLSDKIETRKANDNGSNYQAYGVIVDEEDKGWFIDSEITPSTTSGGDDTVTDGTTYYYPYGKNVTFYAFAPNTSGQMAITTDSSTPSIEIVYTSAHAGNDFTIATPITQGSGKVNYVFKHMMSKINTSIALSSDLRSAGYALNNQYSTTNTTGYYTTFVVPINKGTINAATASPAWSDTTGVSGGISFSNQNSFIIIPQAFTTTASGSTDYGNCTIEISQVEIYLTVNSQTSTMFSGGLVKVGIPDGLITDNEFKMGVCYNITLNITDLSKDDNGDLIFKAVDFDVSVADWTGPVDAPLTSD